MSVDVCVMGGLYLSFPKSKFAYICVNFAQAMTAQLAYDHIADFIAAMNPAKVLELRAANAR